MSAGASPKNTVRIVPTEKIVVVGNIEPALFAIYTTIPESQSHFAAKGVVRILKVARMIADLEGAEDLEPRHLSEAVNRLLFPSSTEMFIETFRAGWLKTVTTNVCLNYLSRYRARWRLFSEMARDDGEGTEEAYEAGMAAEGSPALDLERADRQARLERALRKLPYHQRVPLVLFHLENKSYDEIAALLGVSLGKVKTDIHRGREALRRQFTNNDE